MLEFIDSKLKNKITLINNLLLVWNLIIFFLNNHLKMVQVKYI